VRGVVLDVEVTTGEMNEGQLILDRLDAPAANHGPGQDGHGRCRLRLPKVYGGLERRGIDSIIPPEAEPIRSPVPLRRFLYDAQHDVTKCLRGRVLRPSKRVAHGRFFYSKACDCAGCDLASLCISRAVEQGGGDQRFAASEGPMSVPSPSRRLSAFTPTAMITATGTTRPLLLTFTLVAPIHR
jgi:hypothetical protein